VSGRRCSDALLLIQSILSNNHSSTNVDDINRNFSQYLAAPADPASPIARIQDHVTGGRGWDEHDILSARQESRRTN